MYLKRENMYQKTRNCIFKMMDFADHYVAGVDLPHTRKLLEERVRTDCKTCAWAFSDGTWNIVHETVARRRQSQLDTCPSASAPAASRLKADDKPGKQRHGRNLSHHAAPAASRRSGKEPPTEAEIEELVMETLQRSNTPSRSGSRATGPWHGRGPSDTHLWSRTNPESV